MNSEVIFEQVKQNLEAVIARDTPEGKELWRQFTAMHPADIAQFLSDINSDYVKDLFLSLEKPIKVAVFAFLSESMKIFILSFLDDVQKSELLSASPIDEIADLFDSLSDEGLKRYLMLLSSQDRQQVLSLLEFDPESAGGIMDTEVITLRQDFTVERSIQILQRLQPRLDLHQQIYVTDQDNTLVGHIRLEDLVLKHPSTRLNAILRKNELLISVTEDREEIAKKMIHYHTMIVPVVGEKDTFLGVIPSDTLVDIIEQEASEDVYKISAMTPIKQAYFETSFFRILYERSFILILLLLVQSISTMILKQHEATLCGFFMLFITMLISTGGNSSSQTSALVIQGMASGEIHHGNLYRFLRREFLMALVMAVILGFVSFGRIYITHGQLTGSFIVSLSLALIVMVSVILGSGIPIMFKKLNIDPAFAAGPFLATIMDILGLLIYCYVSKLILS